MGSNVKEVLTLTGFILFAFITSISAKTTSSSSSKQTYETTIARRERNLDHWDAETLAFYLGLDLDTGKPLPNKADVKGGEASTTKVDQYAGIDAAVMFYAQWCPNCHQFAPVWDVIGGLVFAGTTQSNLIMALFNCELNEQHMRLCDGAGVTHYPTLMYVGSGPYKDVDPITSRILGSKDKAAGPYGATTLKRAVKFQGDLNIGDSVLDWIKAMRGLSIWYKWNHAEGGWLKKLRTLITRPFATKKKTSEAGSDALPVGIPQQVGSSSASTSNTTPSYVLEKELKSSQDKVESLEKQVEESQLATTHAGYLIDAFLFPANSNNTQDTAFVDTFDIMTKKNAWNASSTETSDEDEKNAVILKTCMVDISLDYCTRVSTKLTTEYLDSLKSVPDDQYPSFSEMESVLKDRIKEDEPYCAIFHDCYTADFNKPNSDEDSSEDANACRPASCPFKNEIACRYVSTCLSTNIHNEYKVEYEKYDSANDTAQSTVGVIR